MPAPTSTIVGVLFVSLLAFAAPTHAGDIIILDSSVSEILAGETVPEQEIISVPAGAALTLITSDGETRILNGPYQGPIGATRPSEGTSIIDLTTGREKDTRVLGAVRAPKWEVND